MTFFNKKAKNSWAFLWSKHPDYYWKQILTYMSLLVVVVFIGGRFLARSSAYSIQEGFEQQKEFSLELQESSYDPFYAEIYDQLHPVSPQSIDQLIHYIETETQPSKEKSTFLEVGCGTGNCLEQLQEKGYKVAGIDHSPAMISEAQDKCGSKIAFQNKNVLASARTFEEEDFSHILCLGPTTLYEICSPTSMLLRQEASNASHTNLHTFMKHIHKWLRRGGYFVVQIQPLSTLSQSWVSITGGGKSFYHPQFPKRITHLNPYTTEIRFSEVDYKLEMIPPVPSFPSTDSKSSIIATDEENHLQMEYAQEDQHHLQPVRNPFSTIVIEKNQIPRTETVIIKETFMNRKQSQVRQNEWRLTSPYSDTQDWVQAIERHGFALTKAGAIPYPGPANNSTSTHAPIPQIYLFQKL
jgi:SAM-dependent methyltransferase